MPRRHLFLGLCILSAHAEDAGGEPASAEGAFELRSRVDGRPLFMPLFEGTRRVASEDPELTEDDLRRYIERTLERYVTAP